MNLTSLEKAVLKMMIENSSEHREIIQQQLEASIIERRKFTDVGFFTDFILPPNANVRRDLPNMELNKIGAEFPTIEHGAGFLLFVRDGVINMLEGYTYDEPWPENTDTFKLFKIGEH